MLGDTDATTAAARLRLIQTEFTTPHRTGPITRGAPGPSTAPPIDLGILDHLRASVDEVITHTRAQDPAATPPAEAAAVYGWMREHTAHLDTERRLAGEAIVYRQSLEHALAMGEEAVIQPHPCPACGCYGLQWQSSLRRAYCAHKDCKDETGRRSMFTLARLAQQYVQTREKRSRRAT